MRGDCVILIYMFVYRLLSGEWRVNKSSLSRVERQVESLVCSSRASGRVPGTTYRLVKPSDRRVDSGLEEPSRL